MFRRLRFISWLSFLGFCCSWEQRAYYVVVVFKVLFVWLLERCLVYVATPCCVVWLWSLFLDDHCVFDCLL